MTLRYTPGQLRGLVGISRETLRYWKRDLPALTPRAGHAPCFEPGDLVAAAVVKAATEQAGIAVGRLRPVAEELFATCRRTAWPELERSVAVLGLTSATFRIAPEGALAPSECAVLIPLAELVRDLRSRLLDAPEPTQVELPFPLVEVAFGRGRR